MLGNIWHKPAWNMCSKPNQLEVLTGTPNIFLSNPKSCRGAKMFVPGLHSGSVCWMLFWDFSQILRIIMIFLRNYVFSGGFHQTSSNIWGFSSKLEDFLGNVSAGWGGIPLPAFVEVRGSPERDIPSLGTMGLGTGGWEKLFSARRRRTQLPRPHTHPTRGIPHVFLLIRMWEFLRGSPPRWREGDIPLLRRLDFCFSKKSSTFKDVKIFAILRKCSNSKTPS